MFPNVGHNKKRYKCVQEIVAKHLGLRQLQVKYPWLTEFLKAVVRGRLALNRPVDTNLDCLTVAEAKRMGESLPQALRARKTPQSGLYQWKNQNMSVRQMCAKYDFFEPMMLAISQEVLKSAPWGVVWRVCTGAILYVHGQS